MPESTFTFRVDEDLKAAFTAAAKANDRNAAQVLREAMREYVAEEAPPSAEYVEWLRKKVDASWAEYQETGGIPGDEVEARFVQQRTRNASEEVVKNEL